MKIFGRVFETSAREPLNYKSQNLNAVIYGRVENSLCLMSGLKFKPYEGRRKI